MARIKIEDLPVLEEIQQDELKGIFGGGPLLPSPDDSLQPPPDQNIVPTAGDRTIIGF